MGRGGGAVLGGGGVGPLATLIFLLLRSPAPWVRTFLGRGGGDREPRLAWLSLARSLPSITAFAYPSTLAFSAYSSRPSWIRLWESFSKLCSSTGESRQMLGDSQLLPNTWTPVKHKD